MTGFTERAHKSLADSQLRRNLAKATSTIRQKTMRVQGELSDWEALRDAGRSVKRAALAQLSTHLVRLEETVTRAGGQVHWARDAAEARRIVTDLAKSAGAKEVIKIKSMTTDEVALNPALLEAGIVPHETDLADMIVQMAGEMPSHLLVPAIHKNRSEIRDLFEDRMHRPDLTDRPVDLTAAARTYLREKFLSTKVAISGANFAVAETGTVCVVESEGNGRMCLTLPETLISIMGIEKVLPLWEHLEIFLQLLPRAATGERMNPYTSLWTGVTPGDGPKTFHLVLLDNGRTDILADPATRETLYCIRCSRCLNVCPVYERAGGHAYHSMYQGPIGAIVTPQLKGMAEAGTLPFASSLCGACKEACPLKIDIPNILVTLRARAVSEKRATLVGRLSGENIAMALAAGMFNHPGLFALAQKAGRLGQVPLAHDGKLSWLPGALGGWTMTRDMPALPSESFRSWWHKRRKAEVR